jgi:hypothetical protein
MTLSKELGLELRGPEGSISNRLERGTSCIYLFVYIMYLKKHFYQHIVVVQGDLFIVTFTYVLTNVS